MRLEMDGRKDGKEQGGGGGWTEREREREDERERQRQAQRDSDREREERETGRQEQRSHHINHDPGVAYVAHHAEGAEKGVHVFTGVGPSAGQQLHSHAPFKRRASQCIIYHRPVPGRGNNNSIM